MDTSFTETLMMHDRERETEIERVRWKSGQFRVLLVLEKRKRDEMRARKVKGILYSCSTLLRGAGIRDLPNGPEDRTVKAGES